MRRTNRLTLRIALALCMAVHLIPLVRAANAAGPYDPQVVYRTVSTERFAVHYPQGAFNLAVRVGRLAEELLRTDAALLQWMPRGTIDIVLTDTSDAANGSAEVLPHNCLRLFLVAPTDLDGLNAHDDWLRFLLTHELAHIVDIDHAEGVAGVLHRVFGKVISFNGTVPQYLSEGVAVWTETKLTPYGRGRSSYIDTVLRMAALEGRFVRLDQAHLLLAHYPMGSAPYYYGGRFHLYLSQRLGDGSVARLHKYYASQPIPWIYYFGAKRTFGKSLPALWRDFTAHETALAAAQANATIERGITPSTRLYEHVGALTGARYQGDNSIVFSSASPVDGSTIRRWRPEMGLRRSQRLFRDTTSARIAPDPLRPGDFVYAMASITHRFDSFADLFAYDAGRKRRTRLRDANHPNTPLRARHPAIRPDGNQVAFVQTNLQQSWLSVAELARDGEGRLLPSLQVRVLVPPSGEVQHASPAYSPDGRFLAVSTFFGHSARDIIVIDADRGSLVRRITSGAAQDGNPVWSRDGRFVLYESDASGISNLYAFELATLRYFRITNVVGGAFAPDISADQTRILFRQATGRGFALHEMPYAPEHWQPMAYQPGCHDKGIVEAYAPLWGAQALGVDHLASNGSGAGNDGAANGNSRANRGMSTSDDGNDAWPLQPLPASAPRADEPKLTLSAQEREGPYRPSRGLKPWGDNWLLIPGFVIYNNRPGFDLSYFAADSLQRHSYTVGVGGLWGVPRPNVWASYANDRWLPTYSVGASYRSAPYKLSTGQLAESSAAASLGVSWPWAKRHRAALSYNLEDRWLTGSVPADWPHGRFATMNLSYTYRFVRSFAYSISGEAGHMLRLGVQAYARALGGQYDQFVLSLDTRHYLNVPFLQNHVLALRLVANWAVGPDSVQKFFLYGSQAASVVSAQSSRLLPLRGFYPLAPLGAPAPGDGIAALYTEYRFPIWHVQRGIWSLPVYFEHLHAAVFADVGNTLTRAAAADAEAVDRTLQQFARHLWMSVGAEVRADLNLAWAVPLTVRFGLAQPVVARGAIAVDTTKPRLYIDVGTLF